MAHIRKWKRWQSIACSHGAFVDREAVKKVLKFRNDFKPEIRIHKGDIYDFSAFRGGTQGTRDEAEQIDPDLRAGAELIGLYSPTDVLIGNHDERIWTWANHHNAVWAKAAMACRNEFLTACQKAGVKRLVDTYDVAKSFIELGDFKVLHGFFYNENALRDHAEVYGNCIIGHLHTPGVAIGRRLDSPRAYCAGMLADAEKLAYSRRRRATLRWGLGFLWGETDGKTTIVNISQCESGNVKNWRLPI